MADLPGVCEKTCRGISLQKFKFRYDVNPEGTTYDDGDIDGGMPEDQEDDD